MLAPDSVIYWLRRYYLLMIVNRQYATALKYYGKDLAIRLKVHGEAHPSTGDTYNNMGSLGLRQPARAATEDLSSVAFVGRREIKLC